MFCPKWFQLCLMIHCADAIVAFNIPPTGRNNLLCVDFCWITPQLGPSTLVLLNFWSSTLFQIISVSLKRKIFGNALLRSPVSPSLPLPHQDASVHQGNPVSTRVSHFSLFFELSYTLVTTHALGLYEFTKKNFSVIDQKLKCGERFLCLHFLQGKNAQNRPENQQNWNLA